MIEKEKNNGNAVGNFKIIVNNPLLKFIAHTQVSDTHYEDITYLHPEKSFYDQLNYPVRKRVESEYSVIMLCGDIFELKNKNISCEIFKTMAKQYDLVLYIPGNHCYYNGAIGRAEEKLREGMKDTGNFFLLQNQELDLVINGVSHIYLGATLWTNFDNNPILMRKAGGKSHDQYTYLFTDYKKINFSNKPFVRLKPEHVKSMFIQSELFLEQSLQKHSQENKSVFVLTHHAPSLKSASHFNSEGEGLAESMSRELDKGIIPRLSSDSPEWIGDLYDEYTPLYCNNLDRMIEKYKPVFWAHGHIHRRKLYYIGDTLISCDPTGYACDKGKESAKKERSSDEIRIALIFKL